MLAFPVNKLPSICVLLYWTALEPYPNLAISVCVPVCAVEVYDCMHNCACLYGHVSYVNE